jgi:hypothetical protein
MKSAKTVQKKAIRNAIAVLVVELAAFAPLMAVPVASTGSDGSGKSSFDTGAIFGGSPHPASGNDYEVSGGHLIRTPQFVSTAETNVVFRGDSLSLGNSLTAEVASRGQLAIKTVYTADSKRASVTVGDLRLYNHAYVSMSTANAKCRLAGGIAVYASADRPAQFSGSNDTNRIFEVSAALTGSAETGIKFHEAKTDSEFRIVGDMSGYFGKVQTDGNCARLVLACPYAASLTLIGASDKLTLGPGFSYAGTGTVAIPAGTRFVAGYDAEAGTSVPVVLDAAHFTLASGGFEIALDAESLHSAADYAGKTLPIAKIPEALRTVTEADFTDVTVGAPSEYGLPSRTVKVERDGKGMQIVSIVTRPYVKMSDLVESANPGRANGRWYVSDANLWEDGNVPEAGKDYLVQPEIIVKNYLRTIESNGANYVFPGRSLTVCQDFAHKAGWLNISNLVIRGGAAVGASGNGTVKPWQFLYGTIRLLDATWSNPANIQVQNTQFMELASDISGSGVLRFAPINASPAARARILGDNSAFTGGLWLYSEMADGTLARAVALEFDAPENLGGALPAFDYRALAIDRGCTLSPRKPMTLLAKNRGIFADTLGIVEVTNATFAVWWPIRMTGAIRKTGGGVLSLGGAVSFGADGKAAPNGANNVLEVAQGGILPLSTNGFAGLSISFEAGTRMIADASAADENVRAYGLYNAYGAFCLPDDGKLRATIANAPAGDGRFSVALCTVTPEAATALDGNIIVDRLPHKTVSVRRESVVVGDLQMVRFSACVQDAGFRIIFR